MKTFYYFPGNPDQWFQRWDGTGKVFTKKRWKVTENLRALLVFEPCGDYIEYKLRPVCG